MGAEKALFRALKTKGKTPKYGLLFNSTFIGRAGAANKGKISRYLANKCAIASRIDCFSDYPTAKIGESLRDQVEERLKFVASGTKPRKNKDAMAAVLNELKEEGLFYGDNKRAVGKNKDAEMETDEDEAPKKSKKDKKEKSKKESKKKESSKKSKKEESVGKKRKRSDVGAEDDSDDSDNEELKKAKKSKKRKKTE